MAGHRQVPEMRYASILGGWLHALGFAARLIFSTARTVPIIIVISLFRSYVLTICLTPNQRKITGCFDGCSLARQSASTDVAGFLWLSVVRLCDRFCQRLGHGFTHPTKPTSVKSNAGRNGKLA